MSDISLEPNYEFPYEVESAGAAGLGCFATRDIEPGEIILVEFTNILVPTGNHQAACEAIIKRYEELDEDTQSEWRSLTAHLHDTRWQLYMSIYNKPGPDGKPLCGNRSPEFYTMLHMQYDSNCFDLWEVEGGSLYMHASRFNHSCDPNVWYENDQVAGRWVARANRNIAKGEQLFISYLANHAPTARRQMKTAAWGFTCDCAKCLAKNDIYTAFLEDSRDFANGAGLDWARTISTYKDTPAGMEQQLTKRVDLLTQADTAAGDDKSITKELVFALLDLSWFFEHHFIIFKRNGGQEEDFLPMLKSALDTMKKALDAAMSAWPQTHEIVMIAKREITRWEKAWESLHKKAAS